MAKRKVRHATIQYFIKDDQGGFTSFETAFRNQIVDVPADQVERLDKLGATVPVDQDLERPGRMLTLPDTATDAEILSWVMGASNSEVEGLVSERPVMAGRIEAAAAAVKNRFQEQNLHLGGLKTIAEAAATEAQAATEAEADANAAASREPSAGEDLIGADLEADSLVKGNAKAVTDYIADNPSNAPAVLEAEGRLATTENRPLRTSVVRAAEAAAGFTAQ